MFDIYQWCSGVHPLDVPGYIRLYGSGKLFIVHNSPKDKFYGYLGFVQYCDRFGWMKGIYSKNGSSEDMEYN